MALPKDVQFIGYVTRVAFDRETDMVFFPTNWVITMNPGDDSPIEGVHDVSSIAFPAAEADVVAGIKKDLAAHLTEVFGEPVSPDQLIGCYPG